VPFAGGREGATVPAAEPAAMVVVAGMLPAAASPDGGPRGQRQ